MTPLEGDKLLAGPDQVFHSHLFTCSLPSNDDVIHDENIWSAEFAKPI